jgi:hypothetical protein
MRRAVPGLVEVSFGCSHTFTTGLFPPTPGWGGPAQQPQQASKHAGHARKHGKGKQRARHPNSLLTDFPLLFAQRLFVVRDLHEQLQQQHAGRIVAEPEQREVFEGVLDARA